MWFATLLSRREGDRGTSLVEFALVFPVLVGLLFGIIDGGRFIGARVMLSQAAAVAARTTCLQSSTGQSDVDSAVTGSALMLGGVNVDWSAYDCAPSPAAAGCTGWPKAIGSTVVLTTRYNFQAGFFKAFSRLMTQKSRMVCE